ncbi:MAG: rod shape-determining protein MreD [Dehalococcoidia bacterium]|nr:rod shape-determining protein MreD [Dehalococcoidia bacterium]
MTLYFAVPVLFIAGLLQTTLLPHVVVLNVKPDLVLLFVVIWGTAKGSQEGIIWGLVGGLVLDLLGAGPFGAATIAMVAVAFLTSIGEFDLVRSSLLLPLTIMFGGTMAFYAIYMLIIQAGGGVVDWEVTFRSTLLPAGVINTLLTPVVYWIIRRISEWVKPARNLDW